MYHPTLYLCMKTAPGTYAAQLASPATPPSLPAPVKPPRAARRGDPTAAAVEDEEGEADGEGVGDRGESCVVPRVLTVPEVVVDEDCAEEVTASSGDGCRSLEGEEEEALEAEVRAGVSFAPLDEEEEAEEAAAPSAGIEVALEEALAGLATMARSAQ